MAVSRRLGRWARCAGISFITGDLCKRAELEDEGIILVALIVFGHSVVSFFYNTAIIAMVVNAAISFGS